jgi:hypothetical protein
MRGISVLSVVGLLAVSGGAFAQSFNIEFGEAGSAPSSSYAAAGLPGVWNTYGVMPFGTRFPLVDIHGNAVAAQIYNIGGTGMLAGTVPGTTGDDAGLLGDALTSLNNPLDACIFFEGMDNGDYEILMYAITPGLPTGTNRVSVDFAAQGPTVIGGAWSGSHEEGVSYARFTVTVTNGRMGMHSGLPGSSVLSSLNGIQIRRIVDCPGDTNGDAVVNFTDLNAVLAGFGQSGAGLPGDVDGDGAVNFTDLNLILSNFGEACDG